MKIVPARPFEDQKPGTSGLRKKVTTFQKTGYLETYIQSIFDTIPALCGSTIVIGGDGRFYNDTAIQIILSMAAANGVKKALVSQSGLLSTPACSHVIRKYGAAGGFTLSASHNPGGPSGDFGIKYNGANGGPIVEAITEKIYNRSLVIDGYKIADNKPIALDKIGRSQIDEMEIEIFNGVKDYADLMETLFDFGAIRKLMTGGFDICFDAMHAITSPYAEEIFVNRLGASPAVLMNSVPLPDFGGGHPDPGPTYAKDLFTKMFSRAAPDFGACSDGDGDRHIALGPNTYVSPSDSLAILTANAHLVKAYRKGLSGVARSMPTSRAVDRVAKKLGIECFETPTGWKFFGNLLEAGRITICGEESASAGANHIREKDGIWAVLMWLNIIAVSKKNVEDIQHHHWQEFGRNYYSRHDYEGVENSKANSLMQNLEQKFDSLKGMELYGETIRQADNFTYVDPIDGSVSKNQGLRIDFESESRIVFRLSGTGTVGATVRLYLERYVPPTGDLNQKTQAALHILKCIADEIAEISTTLDRTAPTVIS